MKKCLDPRNSTDSVDLLFMPDKRPLTLTHRGRDDTSDGSGALGATQMGTVVGASAASAPFMLIINVGICLCGTSIVSTETTKFNRSRGIYRNMSST